MGEQGPELIVPNQPSMVIPGGDMGDWTVPAPYQKPQNWQQKRWNDLSVYDNPEKWVYIDHPKFKDYYSKDSMKNMADAAKNAGVDPFAYTAIGIAESGLGNTAYQGVGYINPGHITEPTVIKNLTDPKLFERRRELEMIPTMTKDQMNEYDDLLRKIHTESGAKYLKILIDKYGYDKGIRAYNGLGSGPTQDYAGRIKGIISVLKNNEEVNKLIR